MTKGMLFLLGLIILNLQACVILGMINPTNSKVIYNQALNDTTSIKIKYGYYHARSVFYFRSFVNGKQESSFEISDFPERFVITKRDPNIDSNYHYILISNISHGQLRCIDYLLLRQHQTAEVEQSFIKVTEAEISYFKKLEEIIKTKKINFQFTNDDIMQMKGWVKLYY